MLFFRCILLHIQPRPMGLRKLSVEVTPNITLLTTQKNVRIKKLTVEPQKSTPLVIILSWLMAKKNHITKYANFYMDRGFDVVNIRITPWQLLWPVKGTQIVASDVVKFLDCNQCYNPLVIHGFSVGGYVWSEALVHIIQNEPKYKNIADRVRAQVWDSLADITEIDHGFPSAVFPGSPTLQSLLRRYTVYHLKTFDQAATCHYMKGRDAFYNNNPVRAPALLLLSKVDPVGSEKANLKLKDIWTKLGIPVTWKCWDDSPHVSHFYHHPKEYLGELERFLGQVGVSGKADIQSKL